MNRSPYTYLGIFAILAGALCACSGGNSSLPSVAAAAQTAATATRTAQALSSPAPGTVRAQFLGAFFRPEGTPPYGVFSTASRQTAPNPYPTPGTSLFGAAGYCDRAVSGVSISSGYLVDANKLANVVDLGVKWTRTPAPQFMDDESHTFGSGMYAFGDFDSAQCAVLRENITPVVGLEAGPVMYNAVAGKFSPASVPIYKTAGDFGTWCGVVAAHEKAIFPAVSRFSLPGNEVDSDPALFPGGVSQIAAYSEACYKAIKAALPAATVYGFELNMDGSINVPAFVQQLYALGCKPGTCYDALAVHLSLNYPIPPASAPCYPAIGGMYAMNCIAGVQAATHANVHVLVSETVYPVPAGVPDAATQAAAVVAELQTYAADSAIDGVSYADVDECALYPTGFFAGGCLVNLSNQRLPAYSTLASLALADYQ